MPTGSSMQNLNGTPISQAPVPATQGVAMAQNQQRVSESVRVSLPTPKPEYTQEAVALPPPPMPAQSLDLPPVPVLAPTGVSAPPPVTAQPTGIRARN
jgi:hypothetical protein